MLARHGPPTDIEAADAGGSGTKHFYCNLTPDYLPSISDSSLAILSRECSTIQARLRLAIMSEQVSVDDDSHPRSLLVTTIHPRAQLGITSYCAVINDGPIVINITR
jgi:hypothetical protein